MRSRTGRGLTVDPERRRAFHSSILYAAALAYTGVLWLQMLLASGHGAHEGALGLVEHWLRDATLALAPVLTAVLLIRFALARVGVRGRPGATAAAQALGAATALALASPVHALLFDQGASATSAAALAGHALEVLVTVLPVTLLVTAVALALRTHAAAGSPSSGSVATRAVAASRLTSGSLRASSQRPARPRLKGRAAAAGVTAMAVVAPLVGGLGQAAPAAAETGVCAAATRTITYEVAAFETVIPLNGWGDHIPNGLVYALRNSDARVGKTDILANPNLTQPLVLRANVGDCIKVKFRNDVRDRNVGMHADGLVQFDPKTSDGGRVGNNPDTSVAPGDEIEYTWFADRTGEAAIVDIANMHEDHGTSTTSRGLYGAIVVHEQGSTWHNQITGDDLMSRANGTLRAVETQLFADVRWSGEDYRSITNIFLDENEGVLDASGQQPTFPTTGLADSTFGLNYRSEPVRNRIRAVLDHRAGKPVTLPNGTVIQPEDNFCDGWDPTQEQVVTDPNAKCTGEEFHLQSWPFGDEGKLVSIEPPDEPAAEEAAIDDANGETTASEEADAVPAPDAEPAEAEGSAEGEQSDAEVAEVQDDQAEQTDADVQGAETEQTEQTEQTETEETDAEQTGAVETEGVETAETAAADTGGSLPNPAAGRITVDSDNLIAKAYIGDPVKMHVINPGAKETHPFHQHTQRWLTDPDNPTSPVKDVQSLGPGEAYVFKFDGGAGGPMKTVGDLIYHCHLYPHFAQGFWGHLRVFDKLRDGGEQYPDGTPIQALKPLADRDTPEEPTDEEPGFPLFVAGDYGQKAYRPPYAVLADPYNEHRRWGDSVKREPTQLEKDNLPALHPDRPGAAFVDPCPAGAPSRKYYPNAVDVPIKYNSAGWADPEGRVYLNVPPGDTVQNAIRRVGDQPEPFAIRAQLGDCVQLETTNNLHLDDLDHEYNAEYPEVPPVDVGNDKDGVYMHEHVSTEVTTHVHLVQFDELGSDGTSVGWNYVQGPLTGQTYGYRWWVDLPLRTVFFHDHQFPNSFQQKGLYAAMHVEPPGSTWHDPRTGRELPGGVGTVADIRMNPSWYRSRNLPKPRDFREISVFYHDRSPMWHNGLRNPRGNPVNPPPAIDDFGAEQGGVSINYRNEPFQIRTKANATGQARDPAYTYSSAVHGDPSTPVFRAYSGDPVIVRLMNGSHEEYHTFNLHGHRWMNQADNPDSTWTDSQHGAIGEWFNYELDSRTIARGPQRRSRPAGRALDEHIADPSNGIPAVLEGANTPGDYLYGSQNLDDQWLGMWGIFRVPSVRVSDLQQLPDRPPVPGGGNPWPALQPRPNGQRGNATQAVQQVSTCPARAPQRAYDITAIQQEIVYNERTGDRDPHGLMYALTEDVPAVRNGTKATEPLFIRANAGDCLRVTLRNGLTGPLPDHDDIRMWEDVRNYPKSSRVSLHAGLVDYDVTRADGATVGYNFDQTVAPGQSLTYFWYVPEKLSGATIPLVDYADRRGHRHHGLHGGLLVEPTGSTWTHPVTGAPAPTGAQADIKWAGGRHREFVADVQDGLSLRDENGRRLPNAVAGALDDLDPHDSGTRGINYRTERFAPRLAEDSAVSNVFSSEVHGDPATPIFEAYAGDPVRLRLLQSSDRSRVHVFTLSGHQWHEQFTDPRSTIVSSRPLMVGYGLTADLLGGAGGRTRQSGDYLYRDANLLNQTNQGLWGLVRVHGPAQQPGGLRPL